MISRCSTATSPEVPLGPSISGFIALLTFKFLSIILTPLLHSAVYSWPHEVQLTYPSTLSLSPLFPEVLSYYSVFCPAHPCRTNV